MLDILAEKGIRRLQTMDLVLDCGPALPVVQLDVHNYLCGICDLGGANCAIVKDSGMVVICTERFRSKT